MWGALQFCVYALALRTVVGRGATIAPYLAFPAGLLALVMGQNAMLTAALFAGATAAVAARREILAGILFGLLCYKPHFGLLVPVALVADRYWRATAAAAVTVAGLVLVSAAIFGASVWLAYVSSFLHATAGVYGATHAGATSTGSTVPAWWLISPYGVALSFGLARSTALAVQAVAALAAAAAVAVIWRRRESGPGSRAMVLLAGTMLSAPVILYYGLAARRGLSRLGGGGSAPHRLAAVGKKFLPRRVRRGAGEGIAARPRPHPRAADGHAGRDGAGVAAGGTCLQPGHSGASSAGFARLISIIEDWALHSTLMNGRAAVGSTSTSAPFGIALVISTSKPDIMVKSASAAPCTMIGLTRLKHQRRRHHAARRHLVQHPGGRDAALGGIEHQHAPDDRTRRRACAAGREKTPLMRSRS